jgi:hypothetical protein
MRFTQMPGAGLTARGIRGRKAKPITTQTVVSTILTVKGSSYRKKPHSEAFGQVLVVTSMSEWTSNAGIRIRHIRIFHSLTLVATSLKAA